MMFARSTIAGLVLVAVCGYCPAGPQSVARFDGFNLVDKTGQIRMPGDFQNTFRSLGTIWNLDAKKGDQIHSAYASPGAVEWYRRSGKFPDGAVLIMQSVDTEQDRSKRTMAARSEWFVMIKDTKGRYFANPLWGDGWGWALFRSEAPEKQVATDYRRECLTCHVSARRNDWVLAKDYPDLRSN
jgi:hypothetical protein